MGTSRSSSGAYALLSRFLQVKKSVEVVEEDLWYGGTENKEGQKYRVKAEVIQTSYLYSLLGHRESATRSVLKTTFKPLVSAVILPGP